MIEFICKSLSRGHTEYRLQAKEYNKKSHTIKQRYNNKEKTASSKVVGIKCFDIHKEWYIRV